jgi:hypothetical protein
MKIEGARKRAVLVSVACLAAAYGAVSSDAAADCHSPLTYVLFLEKNTVFVCPPASTGWACPSHGDMLREDAVSGATVKLHNDFAPRPEDHAGIAGDPCYVDECVPPGMYDYGFANPCFLHSDDPDVCGITYNSTVGVVEPLGDCQRLLGTTPPEPCTGCSPWDETPGSETPDRMNGCLAGLDCDDADGGEETVGVGADEYACACSLLADGRGIILPANLALMVVGLLLLLAGRRKRR